MICDYERAIEKIEERIVQIKLTDTLCKADKVSLIKLYEEELSDLMCIYRYLTSPSATVIFPDLDYNLRFPL